MKLIVIEGCDGTGTTSHADALAEGLNRQGYPARPYHHPPHRTGAGDWERSLHYARERAEMVSRPYDGVWVCDRWYPSTQVLAHTVREESVRERMLALTELERGYLPVPLLTVVLDAPEEVLDARLRARGEAVTERDRILRSLYRALPCDARVDTRGYAAEVRAELFALALASVTQP